jgi:hypothetical protein
MTTFFLIVCGVSVIFFLVFLWQCGKPRRPAKHHGNAFRPSGLSMADSMAGRSTLSHLESQMEEFLGAHHRRASLLLVGLVLVSTAAIVKGQDVDTPLASNAPVAVDQPSQSATSDGSDSKTTDPKPDPPVTPPATTTGLTGNFFQRLGQAYLTDWKGSSEDAGPEPKYRGFPPPVTNPPFPFTVWPYGGSVTIGYPWTQSGPLMQAIWSGKGGEAWKRSGIQIYGWFNGGFNVSTSNGSGYANLPAAYAERPNTFQPDQQALYIERQPDTVQTEHFDWGFRLATIYGIDYRFTTAKGIFSQQLLSHNYEYGVDPVMFYVDLYYPHVAQGMNIRIGRYISLPDIEAQLAPNNYTYSHSLLYTYDCYTQTSVNTTVKVNNHWLLQAGISAGCEAAPWTAAPDSKVTFNFCASYTWNEGADNIYPCLNALNSGKYAYNNLNSVYNTWYHKFRNHPSLHMATEAWYMWERQVPNVLNPDAAHLIETNANGAVCSDPQVLNCYAPEWAVVNYVEKELNKSNYLSFRNEYFDDIRGQRTGFKTRYYEGLLGWGHWIGTAILLRPELRYEHAFDAAAYDNGTKKTQFMFASDIIWFY